VRVRRQFSERVSGGLSLSGGRTRSDEPLLFFEDRRYGFGQLNVDWRVAERLWLSFDVGTRAQEYFQSERARATFAQLSFSYRGRGS
jgi:hypothetical protein